MSGKTGNRPTGRKPATVRRLSAKNDGAFGASVEPLMPLDYAVGVGTFVPNNAVIMHDEAVALMSKMMKERGIKHTTSECTLRGFTCATVDVDPKVATPAEIAKMRKLQVGWQVDGITGGLEFPGAAEPDYWDFIYFSFTLGMCFGTSDVQILSRMLRRAALMQVFLSYSFATILIALVINAISTLL